MKLELKHIAPYLPYDLECQLMGEIEENGEPIIFDVVSASQEYITYANKDSVITDEWVIGDETFLYLRPLSDLTKEIEHNGEKFVPAVVLWSISIKEEEAFNLYGKIPDYWENNMTLNPNHYDWATILKMLSWHFDIFGLLDANLAVPKN